MLYLLDTCTLSYLEDPHSEFNAAALSSLESLSPQDEVCLSILSVYELEYGLRQGGSDLAPAIETAKREALESYRILPLSREGASIFSDLKCSYRKLQEPRMSGNELAKHLSRHTVDMIIASSAIEYGATVVSNDRFFEGLRQLRADFQSVDWTASPRG